MALPETVRNKDMYPNKVHINIYKKKSIYHWFIVLEFAKIPPVLSNQCYINISLSYCTGVCTKIPLVSSNQCFINISLSYCTGVCTNIVSSGAVRSELLCSNAYGDWFAPRPRHSVRMTYRPSAALRLLGSLRISHNKFLRANK